MSTTEIYAYLPALSLYDALPICEVGDRIGRTRPGKGRRLGRGDLRLDPLGRAARKHLALDRAHLAFEPVDAMRDRAIILRIGHAGPETEAGGGGDNDCAAHGTPPR